MAKQSLKREWGCNLILIGLVLILMGAAFWMGKSAMEVKWRKALSGEQELPIAGAQQPQVALAAVVTDAVWQKLLKDPVAIEGNEDAKVVIVEFTDYQCPFCKRAADQTYPEIMKQYVDTGKVKYVLRDLPLPIHQNAAAAALAARCAGEQGKYWQMHDQLFDGQADWSTGNVDAVVKSYGQDMGLDVSKFSNCYDAKKYQRAIEADISLGNEVGVTSVPTYFINKRELVGAQPLTAFQKVIEEELKK